MELLSVFEKSYRVDGQRKIKPWLRP